MIIYPPYIGDTVPAFTDEGIQISYSLSPGIASSAIKRWVLQIKDLQSNSIGIISLNQNENDRVLNFPITDITLTKGQYYKFQLACDDTLDNDITQLVFSTAAIGRYISKPIISLQETIINKEFIGTYSCATISEPLYSYRFILKDYNKQIVEDTGEFYWDSSKSQVDSNGVTCKIAFSTNNIVNYETGSYILELSITTVNGYQENISHTTQLQLTMPPLFNGKLLAYQDSVAKDNGYINIAIEKPINADFQHGKFILEKTSDNNTWIELDSFVLYPGADEKQYNWKDFDIKQGIVYTYALRQYSETNMSMRFKSSPIIADFEDMFLSDGERQLKIRFNPQISSFKETILESKLDTIDRKYPFFFRNEQVRYKEFSISGLISYQIDEANFFTDEYNNVSTNLTKENIFAEREFKLQVLEWLNNGQPKYFRSPVEGNYVVRLMGVSLSPNDTVGRMLHTFNCTAYEIAAADYKSLKQNNLLRFDKVKLKYYENTSLLSPQQNREISNIKNLVWYGTPGSSIILDSQTKEITTGIYKTPLEQVYSSLRIEGDHTNSSFYFEELIDNSSKYEKDKDKFANISPQIVFKTIAPEEEIKDSDIAYIYWIILRKKEGISSSDLDYIATFTYNDEFNETIDLSSGEPVYYQELGNITNITKGNGVQIDICYLKIDEFLDEIITFNRIIISNSEEVNSVNIMEVTNL